MKSPLTLLHSLWMDIQRLCPDVKGLERDFETLEYRFEHEGYGFLTIALPALGAAFTQGLASGKFACPPNFKPVRGGAIPRFLSGMLCEVFEPVSGELKQDPDLGIIKCLREVLYLFKKIQMESDQEALLHEKACTEFFQCDEIAGKVQVPDRHAHLIGLVSKLVLNDLSSKPLNDARFKHGPGAVYEGYSVNQKWSALSESVRNADFDLQSYGYDDFGVALTELSDRAEIKNQSSSTNVVYLENRASSRIARLITVPKSSTSRRTITVEPLLCQFVQQGLNIILRDSIESCKYLSNSLALTDQRKNQYLALEGSRDDNWATIDLKSASDLLSVNLVEIVFRRHGPFLDHMMDCRSTIVEEPVSNRSLSIRKFAGMGNALTFPVQSVCFAVTCIAAIHDSWGIKPTPRSIERATRLVRCYGDDIIVAKSYAHQCVNWLEAVGLKVNISKSFLTGNFKESCGVDAYMGVDVTPLYLKHRPDHPSTEPKVIEGLVALSNHAWLRGLYEFSTCLAYEVEGRLGIDLPLVGQESGSLGWHSRLDAATPTRWNHNLQQFETRTLVSKPLKRRDRLDGFAALLKFFHVPLLGRDKDHLVKTSIRHKLRMAWTWVPTRVG